MKKGNILYLFILSIFVAGCFSYEQSHEGLPYIDVTKTYCEKEVDLTDIADVHYLHLNTKNEDFLYQGSIDYVTQNTIVIVDRSSNSILLFSKNGEPKSRFNRRGQGPEEYSRASSIMYDEDKDEVYIIPDFNDHMKIYSSSGEYKRTLTFPQINIGNQLGFFDNQSILVYDNTKLWRNINKQYSVDKTDVAKHVNDSSFFLISTTDGKVLEYIELPSNNSIDISTIKQGDISGQIGYTRVRKCIDGVLLYNPETDTVFLYNNDKSLSPFIDKKPLLSNLDPMVVMDICMDTESFQFLSIYPYLKGEFPSPIYYMRDKNTGEIVRPKVILPDYKEKNLNFDPRLQNYYENGYHFELDLFELKEAYKENKLSGKLKELVATLDEEEDNNVFMLVQFK